MVTTLPLVFDIGMYDGADTRYYLETGHRVIAVEANPTLVRIVTRQLEAYVSSGQLKIVNAAITNRRGPVTLTINGSDLGGSSTAGMVTEDDAAGTYSIDGLLMTDLLALAANRPRLIKIDIEGADTLCLSALTRDQRPDALSIEVHSGLENVLTQLSTVGFTRFKLIDQTSFREITRRNGLRDRISRKVTRMLGFADIREVRRNRRFFPLYHSSGPAPWESDGPWRSAEDVARLWAAYQTRPMPNVWFDLHAV